ncbi:MAG: translocation/assembly module TamB domain-containing protein [bacterium]
MQRRPWVIVVTLLAFALAFSVLVAIRYLNRSDRLRQQIIKQLQDVPGEISIGSASIAATTLQLTNISYRSPDHGITAQVKRISIRFSLGNWIVHQGLFERLIESVTIIEPEITVRPAMMKGNVGKEDSLKTSDYSRLNFLRHAILRGGHLRVIDRSGSAWMSMHNLDGWGQGVDENRIRVQLAGSLYRTEEQNFTVEATVGLNPLKIESDVALRSYDLSSIELPPGSPLESPVGMFSSHARLVWDLDNWDLTANMQLVDGGFRIRRGPRVTDVNLSGIAEDGLLTIGGEMVTEGDPGTLEAAISYSNGVRLSVTGNIPEVHLGTHLGTFTPLPKSRQPTGTIHGITDFRWNSADRNWSWTIRGTSPLLGTVVGNFHDVSTTLHWDREAHTLRFDSLAATWQGLTLNATAVFQPHQKERFIVNGDVDGRFDLTELPGWVVPLAEKTTHGQLNIREVVGDGWTVSGTGRIRDDDNPAIGEYSATYRAEGYKLRLDLYSPQRRNAWVMVDRMAERPLKITFQDPQTLANWWDQAITVPSRIDEIETRATVELYPKEIRGQADLFDPATGLGVHLFGSLFGRLKESVAGTYGYRLSRHEQQVGYGDFDFAYGDGLLDVKRFSLMDYLSFSGRVDLKERRFNKLELTIEDLDLSHVVPSISAIPESRIDGKVGGQVMVDGSFSQPTIESHFELYDGRYGDLSQYWGVLTLSTNLQGDVFIRRGLLGRSGTTILSMEGGYNIPNDHFNIRLEAPRTDAGALAEAAAGKRNLLDGPIALSGHLGGSLALPQWTASMNMVDAKVAGIAFDDVNIELRGVTSERLGHILYIDRFTMQRENRYQFTASGAAPITRGAGQISARLEGEMLDVLPQLTSFVKGASGSGFIDWTVTVVAGNVAASNGEIQIKNGDVSFQDVFPTLKDLEIDLNVGVDGSLTINKFDGIFGENSPAVIRNERGTPDNSQNLPIILQGVGLDLGVLKLKTPAEGGIPMRIPGVMTTEDYGRIKFSGRENGEWFRVSGPVDSLLMTGSTRIASTRMTLPPIPRNGTGSSTSAPGAGRPRASVRGILTLLRKARWNSQVRIADNVHYERDIVGLENTPVLGAFSEILSQITVDLTLDPTESNRPLEVTGRVSSNNFRLVGELSSTQGRLELLDLNFDLQRADVTFDRTSLLPVVSGRAVTYTVEESSDPNTPRYSRELYLTLYVIDPVTGERTTRGRWGDFTFVLEDQEGSSQEQVLNALGYQAGSLTKRATAIGAGGLERALIRRWLRPIERDIARVLGLDLVRFDPSIASYLIRDNTIGLDSLGVGATSQIKSSSVKVGKYLLPNLFLSYTGQLGSDPLLRYTTTGPTPTSRIAFLQSWDVEYRVRSISPNLVLQGGWEYDNLAPNEAGKRNNRSIRLKYTLVYDLTKVSMAKVWRKLWN